MKRLSIYLSAALALLLCASCQSANPVLSIEGGQVQGVATATKGVTVFKGIPYAAPPVGDLRWAAPAPVVAWEGVRLCDSFGNASVQQAHVESDFYMHEFFWKGDAPYSEDCLTLNIWTPAPGKNKANLPVTLWIHGGAFQCGWGFEEEMDGESWADKGVILVTINYRLGIFGFLAHPELSATSPDGTSGVYGLLDQTAALEWVKRNITAFGGDPDNITVMGQSAGAGSVMALVASPKARTLMSKAIIQSGGGMRGRHDVVTYDLSAAEQFGKAVMDSSNLTSLAAMRAATTDEIWAAHNHYVDISGQWGLWRPCNDGVFTTQSFADAVSDGTIADIPYMIGGTQDDLGNLGEGIDLFARTRAEKSSQPVYAYQFARPLPGDDNPGAFHSSELWYTFGTLGRSWRPFTDGDRELSDQMIDAWTNFAKYGCPDGKQPAGQWEAWTDEKPNYRIFCLGNNGHPATFMGRPLPPSKQR